MLFIFLHQIDAMKNVFLETHNIKNPATGFGTFNHGLVTGLSHHNFGDLTLTLCAENPGKVAQEFKDKFKYKKLIGLNRYKMFRVRDKHDLWHSVNQNLKFEPHKVRKYLLTVHDVNFAEGISKPYTNNKKYNTFVEKLNRSNAITYISNFAKEQTHKYFDVPNVPEYVIYNGNPVTFLENTSTYKPEVPTDKPFLYSIGDFIAKKNFTAIIKMMLHVPGFNLIISGNNNKPYGEEVKQCIADNNLQDRVFLTGKVSNQGKQYYMQHCKGFVLASVAEGFGLPPIEAMKFGKPIFLANRASLPEIGGEHSFYWDDFDPEYMAAVLFKGFDTYNSNKDFYSTEYKKRADSFNWDTAAKQYLEVYHSLLK